VGHSVCGGSGALTLMAACGKRHRTLGDPCSSTRTFVDWPVVSPHSPLHMPCSSKTLILGPPAYQFPPPQSMKAVNIRRLSNRSATQVKTASYTFRVIHSSCLVLKASSGTRVYHWDETAQCFVLCSSSQQTKVGWPVLPASVLPSSTACLRV
jgi:hypothetical protein